MDVTGTDFVVPHAVDLYSRAESSSGGRPPVYKAIGISLAVASGLFIGVSFVLKKIGLLKANVKYNEEAGEGYGYLRNFWWWSGMTLMIVGEICNFVAYAFVDAILVTPLGALAVVVTTILSAIFLKERLSFVGKVGCFCCILGSVAIAMNAPQQSSVSDIQEMQHYVIAPGFLTYAGVIVVGSVITAVWVGPRWGKKSMFVYLSICSMVGGLSVVATQGLGSAIIAQVNGEPQFNKWFLYVLFVFVICTLLTEIVYLNKALNIFNAALVTPTYYVIFTTATIVTSAILFRGFKGSGAQIATVVIGFLQICAGVILLQLSKSAKDVPDAAVFKGDLDQFREVAAQEEPESEPKADSIRGASSIVRRFSTPRRNLEAEEAQRYFRERQEDLLKPPSEGEFVIEWDGLRRRKTILGGGPTMTRSRTPSRTSPAEKPLPPLGMSRFPEPEDREGRQETVDQKPNAGNDNRSFLDRIRSVFHRRQWKPIHGDDDSQTTLPVASSQMPTDPYKKTVDSKHRGAQLQPSLQQPKRDRSGRSLSIPLANETRSLDRNGNLSSGLSQTDGSRRQFSFNTVFNRLRSGDYSAVNVDNPAGSPMNYPVAGPAPRGILKQSHIPSHMHSLETVTEEERLGLARGVPQMNYEDNKNGEGCEDGKVERIWTPSSSESDLGDVAELMKKRYTHPRKSSVSSSSSSSVSAPPPYEEEEQYDHRRVAEEGNYNNNPPPSEHVRRLFESEGIGGEWQMPTTTTTTRSAGPPVPMQSESSSFRRPNVNPNSNPLPPLPDNESPALVPFDGGVDSFMRVGIRPSSPNDSELGVMSISSSSPPSPPPRSQGRGRVGRRHGGWRRGRDHSVGSSSSSSNDEDYDYHNDNHRSVGGDSERRARRGSFI